MNTAIINFLKPKKQCRSATIDTNLKEMLAKERDSIRHTTDKLKQTVNKVHIEAMFKHDDDEITKFEMDNTDWRIYSEFNIAGILCSLSSTQADLTVINVKFEKEGFIPPVKHDRLKTIFVIHGSFTDTVTGITYNAGDVCKLPPFTLHSLKSDDCMLSITWKPAYKEQL